MPHVKHFNPEGRLVVAKITGLRFGGRHYPQGAEITDSTLSLRKKRQLYFQNHLCYDYELEQKVLDAAAAAEERAEQERAEALARERAEQLAAEKSAVEQEEASRQFAERQARMEAALAAAASAAGQKVETPALAPEAPAEIVPQLQAVQPDPAPVVEEAPRVMEEPVVIVEPAVIPVEPAAEIVVAESPAVVTQSDEFAGSVNPAPDAAAPAVVATETGEAGPRRRVVRRAAE